MAHSWAWGSTVGINSKQLDPGMRVRQPCLPTVVLHSVVCDDILLLLNVALSF